MWYDHQFLRLKDTSLAKKDKHAKKWGGFTFYRFMREKVGNRALYKRGGPAFFEFFFSKSVKCKKLAHFWHALLFSKP